MMNVTGQLATAPELSTPYEQAAKAGVGLLPEGRRTPHTDTLELSSRVEPAEDAQLGAGEKDNPHEEARRDDQRRSGAIYERGADGRLRIKPENVPTIDILAA